MLWTFKVENRLRNRKTSQITVCSQTKPYKM